MSNLLKSSANYATGNQVSTIESLEAGSFASYNKGGQWDGGSGASAQWESWSKEDISRRQSCWETVFPQQQQLLQQQLLQQQKVPMSLNEGAAVATLRKRLSELNSKLPNNSPADKAKRKTLLLPQRKQDEGKLTVVLDMDETLIHSEFTGDKDYRQAEAREHATRKPDFSITLYEDDPDMETEIVHVYKRPGLDAFLEKISLICEPVIFTASLPLYARPILKQIDPKRLCRSRLYRNATSKYRGYPHVKCLRHLGRDARRIMLVDNSPYAMCADPYNAYPIKNYYDDEHDNELEKLYNDIVELCKAEDVRPVLHKKFNFVKTLNDMMGGY